MNRATSRPGYPQLVLVSSLLPSDLGGVGLAGGRMSEFVVSDRVLRNG